MTGIPLGPAVGLALRFPKSAAAIGNIGSFLKRNWKTIAVIIAVGGACVSVCIYVGHVKKAAHEAGFGEAQAQAQELVRQANQREAEKQKALDLITQRFGFLAQQREGQVTTVVQPQIERITREVQSYPVYQQCRLTDGVFVDTNAVIAAVNRSLGSDALAGAR
jgi:hypothetical protein